MAKRGSLCRPNGRTIHDHPLSLACSSYFSSAGSGNSFSQYRHEVDEARLHGDTFEWALSADFLHSFLASTFENRPSEFFQLLTFVLLATYLIH
jgi:hypothetical protein